jgi:beta-lactam-binding protein with PASTA domain
VSFGGRALSALGKVGIVLSIIIIFLFGFMGTVYLSLRTAEVKVPDVLGKDRYTAETLLNGVGLNIRVKSARPSAEKPDTILSQLPEAGQVVKAGIPVAVEVSRAPKEGESVPSSADETQKQQEEENKPADNSNVNQSTTTNQNQNQNKPKNKNKNSNNANSKNANNSNKTNNASNANAARNANNANANRTTNNSNRNANTNPNTNRTNTNANKRAPQTTPSPRPGANKGTP